jgi:hypothetical protein
MLSWQNDRTEFPQSGDSELFSVMTFHKYFYGTIIIITASEWAGRPGFDCRQEQEIFLYSTVSKP